MDNAIDISKSLNHITLPIKIEFIAVEQFLRQKMIGEHISSEDSDGKVSNYAKILDLSVGRSTDDNFDIAIKLKFITLTTFFKNKEGELILDVLLGFDAEEQQLFATDFQLDGTTKNWLFNNSMETLANNLMHGKLKNKMKFDFKPEIEKQLLGINAKLDDGLEVAKRIFLSGHLRFFRINEIIPEKNQFSVLVELEGTTLMDVKQMDIEF